MVRTHTHTHTHTNTHTHTQAMYDVPLYGRIIALEMFRPRGVAQVCGVRMVLVWC
jgi:hypothetical protein